MPREPKDEEVRSLLREVENLKRETERLKAKGSLVTNEKAWDQGFTFKLDPMTVSSTTYKLMAGVTGPITIKTEPPKQAFFELKVWFEDGRHEILRGTMPETSLLISDARSGATKNGSVKDGKIVEGDRVALNGVMKAWKRGPDGRPVIDKKK